MDSTARLALDKIAADRSDPVSALATAINTNADKLDTAVLRLSGAGAPAGGTAGIEGRVYRDTDTNDLYYDTGTEWLRVAVLDDTGNVPANELGHALRLAPTAAAANVTASSGELIVATAAITVTLPAHSAGQVVGVLNLIGGGGVVTVDGTAIQGVGLNGATSFPLGTYGARVVLLDDGTNWLIVEGQQDSGWVPLGSFYTGVTTPANDGGYVAASRLRGDVVQLSGTLSNTTSTIGQNTGIASLASSIFHPSSYVVLQSQTYSHYGAHPPGQGAIGATASGLVGVTPSGAVIYNGSTTWAVGVEIALDGLCYRLS